MTSEKQAVRDFWNAESCGERYMLGADRKAQLDSQAIERYRLEPYIPTTVKFHEGRGKDVLEIGVGMGADHLEWAKAGPKHLTGVDLTPRAVQHTRERLTLYGYTPDVNVGDAEELSFDDESFDLVSSWGVLHCSPDTPRAIKEVWRVLRPGGTAKVLIYHTHSLMGYMLWARYALLKGQPFRSVSSVCEQYLESPGTKTYTVQQARHMFEQAGFRKINVHTFLAFGDLLEGNIGARHKGPLLTVAKLLYPRWFIKRFLRRLGGCLFIEAVK